MVWYTRCMANGRANELTIASIQHVCELLLAMLQVLYFQVRLPQLTGGHEGGQQLVVVPGLHYKIGSAFLQGPYRQLDVAIGGDQDHHHARVDLQNPLEPAEAFAAVGGARGVVHVEQDDVEGFVLKQLRYPVRVRFGPDDREVLLQEQAPRGEDIFLVINDQYFAREFAHSVG